MENLSIKPSTNTPTITCDAGQNQISIEGESRPENVRAFYAPLFTWIDEYEKALPIGKPVTLNFKLEYFNSSSLKIFMEVIERLRKIAALSGGSSLNINWYYEENDEDILDSGKEVEKMIGQKFNFIAVS